jgi:hypothetical protein
LSATSFLLAAKLSSASRRLRFAATGSSNERLGQINRFVAAVAFGSFDGVFVQEVKTERVLVYFDLVQYIKRILMELNLSQCPDIF